uniref:EF-hand domain-containing protein n=1 Tax=Macrostomum lignano TaxID=282301 RepID=A0A1I8JP89_9PLAT
MSRESRAQPRLWLKLLTKIDKDGDDEGVRPVPGGPHTTKTNRNGSRRRWQRADRDADGLLSLAEFTDFAHPEEAAHMRELISTRNGDGAIDEAEYIGDMVDAETNCTLFSQADMDKDAAIAYQNRRFWTHQRQSLRSSHGYGLWRSVAQSTRRALRQVLVLTFCKRSQKRNNLNFHYNSFAICEFILLHDFC